MARGVPSRIYPALLTELAERRERGLTFGQLRLYAETQGVNISEHAISRQLLRIGADLPHPRRRASTAQPGLEVRRGTGTVRHFTPAEDAEILRLDAAGWSNHRIGKQLGRNPSSILGRKLTLARQAARAEEE